MQQYKEMAKNSNDEVEKLEKTISNHVETIKIMGKRYDYFLHWNFLSWKVDICGRGGAGSKKSGIE